MGNPVGSLTEEQQKIIVGCLLGDGYMRCKTNAHLQITHSYKQKDYVDWKYNKLKNIVLTSPKKYKGNEERIGYRFFTRSLPGLTYFYRKFYKDKIKVIPQDLDINPLSLAVWFMDDGSQSRRSIYLNTQKFTLYQQKFLMNFLYKKWGIESFLNKDKKYWRIRVTNHSTKIFVNLVKKYIISPMIYKLPL